MRPNPIGVVICRVASVWLAVSGLGGVTLIIVDLVTDPAELDSFFAYSAVMALIPLLSAFLLWHYAEPISTFRFSSTDRAPGEPVDPDMLLSIGVVLVGIWMMAFGVISVFGTEAMVLMQSDLFRDNERFSDQLSPHVIGTRVSNAIQFVIGLGLVVLGKRRLR